MNAIFEISITLFIFTAAIMWPRLAGGAEWNPIPKKVISRLIKIAKTNKKDVLLDLGCGDGRIVIEAAKNVKEAIGIEINPLFFLISLFRVKAIGLKNAKIIFGNFYQKNFDDASIITIFQNRKANILLKEKFSGLKKGTKIVSYYWKIEGWKEKTSDEKNKIYLYEV